MTANLGILPSAVVICGPKTGKHVVQKEADSCDASAPPHDHGGDSLELSASTSNGSLA
jgi:hypothetical protein